MTQKSSMKKRTSVMVIKISSKMANDPAIPMKLRDHGYNHAMRSSSIKKQLSKRLKVDPILQISRILRKKQHAKKIFADTELRLSTANEIKTKMNELKADLEDIENFKQNYKVRDFCKGTQKPRTLA